MAVSSPGSTGLGTCMLKPEPRARRRSMGRPYAVNAIAGVSPPSRGASARTRCINPYPSSPGISMSDTITSGRQCRSMSKGRSRRRAGADVCASAPEDGIRQRDRLGVIVGDQHAEAVEADDLLLTLDQ